MRERERIKLVINCADEVNGFIKRGRERERERERERAFVSECR